MFFHWNRAYSNLVLSRGLGFQTLFKHVSDVLFYWTVFVLSNMYAGVHLNSNEYLNVNIQFANAHGCIFVIDVLISSHHYGIRGHARYNSPCPALCILLLVQSKLLFQTCSKCVDVCLPPPQIKNIEGCKQHVFC